MKKKLIIPGVAIFIVLGLGIMNLSAVYAESTTGNYPPIIQKLAEHFHLNPEEVKGVFEEVHDERAANMHAEFEEKLNDAVSDGKITEDQKQAILDKHEEMQSTMEELRNLEPEERRERMKAYHEELRLWAEENDIEFPFFAFKVGFHKGMKDGMFVEKLELTN